MNSIAEVKKISINEGGERVEVLGKVLENKGEKVIDIKGVQTPKIKYKISDKTGTISLFWISKEKIFIGQEYHFKAVAESYKGNNYLICWGEFGGITEQPTQTPSQQPQQEQKEHKKESETDLMWKEKEKRMVRMNVLKHAVEVATFNKVSANTTAELNFLIKEVETIAESFEMWVYRGTSDEQIPF